MFAAGDAFLFPSEKASLRHFFILISDPELDAGALVLVNLTTWDDEDCANDSCILEPRDWPDVKFLKHMSYIEYGEARQMSLAALRHLVETDQVKRRKNVGPDLLARLLEGARETPHLKWKHRQVLEDQGLIDE